MGRAVPNVFLLSKATGLMMVSLIQPSLRDVRTKKMPPRTKVQGYDQCVPPGRTIHLCSKVRHVPLGRDAISYEILG
jgi:hypothetical protein